MTAVERLVGLKSIAAALGVADEDTVTSWGGRPWDPLPLRDWMGSVCGWPPYLADWQARTADLVSWRRGGSRGEPGLPIHGGWEEIAEAFPTDRSVDTVQRAAELAVRPLPVIGVHLPAERLARPWGPPRVWIYRSALRDWIDGRDRPHITGQSRPKPAAETSQLPLFT